MLCFYLFAAFVPLIAQPADPPPSGTVGISILSIELSSDDKDVAKAARRVLQEQLRDVFHARGRYHWVERADPKMLEQILEELKFQNSGLVASEEAKNLGKLAGIGVFVVVTGDLSVGMFGCNLTLKVRTIDVESSRLMSIYTLQSKGHFRLDPNKSAEDAIAKAMKAFANELSTEPAPKEAS